MVVADGSNLYPAVPAESWLAARHQLCVFHVLKDVNELVVKGGRRLARAVARRGNGGRKRGRGRPSKAKARRAARAAAGPTNKEKAAFVMKHRFLIAKKTSDLTGREWDDLARMFDYLPELRTLWNFAREARDLFEQEATYREVPELEEALGMLEAGKFRKLVAFSHGEAGKKVRTNNHAERANRRLRFAEKVRYKWRRRRWVVRYVLLALDRWWRQAAGAAKRAEERPEPQARAS